MNNPGDVFPQSFIERLRQFLPDRCEKILQALSGPKPTTFRINTLKATKESVLSELTADGWEVESIPWYQEAFIVKKQGTHRIATLPVFTEGRLYLQSLSSMLPAIILNPQQGESILDITAAPGSKTTQIAAMMQNSGVITANDISTIRLYKLKANLKIQGATNVAVTQLPAEGIWQKFP